MQDRRIVPPPRPGCISRRSTGSPNTAIRAGDYLFLSGMLAVDPETGDSLQGTVTSETHRVFQNLRLVLESAGSALGRLVQVHAMLHDRLEYEILNRVYRQYVPAGPPARTVWSVTIPLGFKVQLDAIAVA